MTKNTQPKTWRKVRLGEVGKIITGKTPSTLDQKNFGGIYPFITIPDLKEQKYILRTERTISEKGSVKMKGLKLPQKAVMLSCLATVGEVGITVKESFTNQQINSVICDENRVLPEFLYYTFKYIRPRLLKYSGSVYTNISKSKFADIEIILPEDINEQRNIAEILSAFDDKIELNNKINQTLEEMAQAIFKEWLLKNQKSKIKKQKLGNLMSLRKEKFKKYEEWKNLKLLDLGRFPQKSLAITTYGKGEEIKTAGIKFKKGDILFGAVRPYFHKVVIAPFDGVTNSSVFVIMPKKENYYALLITILFSENTINYASMSASGTKMPVIKWEDLCNMEILIPEEKIIDSFNKIVKNFYDLIIKNANENQKLASLRDLLLPKLMSGEIRV